MDEVVIGDCRDQCTMNPSQGAPKRREQCPGDADCDQNCAEGCVDGRVDHLDCFGNKVSLQGGSQDRWGGRKVPNATGIAENHG